MTRRPPSDAVWKECVAGPSERVLVWKGGQIKGATRQLWPVFRRWGRAPALHGHSCAYGVAHAKVPAGPRPT